MVTAHADGYGYPASIVRGDHRADDPYTGQNTYPASITARPNNGEGFAKNLGGNQLPNAPHFTTSLCGGLHNAGVGGLGGDAAQRFLLAIASSRACSTTGLTTRYAAIRHVNLALILTSAAAGR